MRHLGGLHRQVRSIAGRLRPTLLDDLGIAAALEGMIAELKVMHPSIDFRLKITGLKRRPLPEVETALFRICQEGLSNALRHAQAQRIEVLLAVSHPELILTVRDNGIGLQTDHGSRGYNDGLGLLGIRERATALNGKFYLQSTPGQGTRVRVILPYGSVENGSNSRSDC
jgi:signal transduction histidine kinase